MNIAKTAFTLTELMLSMAIFSIAIIGIFSIYNASIILIDMAGSLTQMSNIASYKLESLYDVEDFNSLDNFNGQTFDLSEFGLGSIAVSVAKGVYKIDSLGLNLKKATVSISYKIRGERVIGEDSNLNGILDSGEDLNSDNRLTSQAEVTTIIAKKQK